MMLPLATSSWDDKEKQALQRVIDSGMFSMGKYVADFEKEFADYIGTQYCVMVNSGSSANLIAVAALFYSSENPLKPGDEVIVPAVSWSTTYFPLQQYGLKVKFIDIDKATLNLDLKALKQAITEKTRAIFAVNLLGNPVDYSSLQKLISDKNIILLEDNCESLGAVLEERKTGSFGLLSTHSSFFSHHISTMEGGMITTDNEELYQIMLSLRSHGWTRHLAKDNLLCYKSNNEFEESFRFILPGYNLRPLDMSGALGLEQLKKLPSIIEGRRQNAEVFINLFSAIKGISIVQETGRSSWFGFAIIVNMGKEKRDEILDMLNKHDVETRPIVAGNFVRNPVIKYFNYDVHGDLNNSDLISDCGFFIGNHHYDISESLEKIATLIDNVLSI